MINRSTVKVKWVFEWAFGYMTEGQWLTKARDIFMFYSKT